MGKRYTEKQKTAIVKRLLKEPLKNLKITLKEIEFNFDSHKIHYLIMVKRHERYVGSWSRKYNRISVDDDLPNRINFDAIALHEAIEKYVCQKYHFKEQGRAHKIARLKERAFVKKRGGNWRSHQRYVYLVWKKEGCY